MVEKDRTFAGSLIYPILFCARHTIDLSIKKIFQLLFRINKHKWEDKIKLRTPNILNLYMKRGPLHLASTLH